MIELTEILKTNNPIKNLKYVLFGISTLIFGVFIDYYLSDRTVTTAYIPLMVMVGFLARKLVSNIIFSGMAATAVQVFSPNEWVTELYILRWTSFFLIAFVIQTLNQNNLKERQNLLYFTTTLAESLDARDRYTAFHSKNIAYYSYEIGKAMKLPSKECTHLYIGGLLHDIGKIGVPEFILTKPSRLTAEEFVEIKKHPKIGYDMLKHIPAFRENSILDMVLSHHERYDGKGYPHGLIGESIPLVARIMAVADSFDAMTSRRVYRDNHDLEYALNEIRKGKQSQFDPQIADVFLELISKGRVIVRGFEDFYSQQPFKNNQSLE